MYNIGPALSASCEACAYLTELTASLCALRVNRGLNPESSFGSCVSECWGILSLAAVIAEHLVMQSCVKT
jgi:hypothetical protein